MGNRSTGVHALVTGSIVFLLSLSACADDVTSPDALSEVSPSESLATQSTDSAYWVNNVLEFTDQNGEAWRVERDQEDATEALLFRNGVYLGAVELSYDGSEVSEVTFLPSGSSHWAKTDTSGAVLETDQGTGGGGGGICKPDPNDCTYPTSFYTLSGDPCQDEWSDMQTTTAEALGAGVVAVITANVPVVHIGTAVGFGLKTADAFGKVVGWGLCMIT